MYIIYICCNHLLSYIAILYIVMLIINMFIIIVACVYTFIYANISLYMLLYALVRTSLVLRSAIIEHLDARLADPRRETHCKIGKVMRFSRIAVRAYRVSLRNESTWET